MRGREQSTAAHAPFADTLLRVVVNGYRWAPASASAVVAAHVAVEPDVERICGVSAWETGSSKLEGGFACSQRAEVGTLRNAPGASGGSRGALIDQRTLLDR